jgi:hypothetical protein
MEGSENQTLMERLPPLNKVITSGNFTLKGEVYEIYPNL